MSSRGVVVLGVAAVVLVFILPPVGLLLGIVTLVFAVRAMRATKPQDQQLLTPDGVPVTVKMPTVGRTGAIFGLVLGIAATTLGALLFVTLVVFWNEVRDYSNCHDNTNTTQGETTCKDQFKNAVLDRLGQ